jgi:uncharacterized protein
VKIQPQIEVLEKLSDIDAEILRVDEELGREREALATKKQHLESLETKLARDRQSLEEIDKTRNELHTEMRQMSIQVEKSREKLARCRTEREANAAQREVEELRKLFRDRELEIEKLNTFAEQARGEIERVLGERDTLAADLGEREGAVAQHLKELEATSAEQAERRKEIVAKVPVVLYRRYEQIRKRRGTAVAPVIDGTCSACHMRLPPMAHHQLQRGDDFGQCPTCNRIIYVPAALSAESRSGGP